MERGMHLESSREFQPGDNGINDAFKKIGTNLPGGQFARVS